MRIEYLYRFPVKGLTAEALEMVFPRAGAPHELLAGFGAVRGARMIGGFTRTLAEAMGRSINTVFARLALKSLTPAQLGATGSALGFGDAPAFDVPVAPSTLHLPDDRLGFARTAAGFWNTTMSPLGGAMLASAILALALPACDSGGGANHPPTDMAAARGDYESAAAAVRVAREEILPRAQETLDLVNQAYQAGEFDFLQVLVARRTFFDTNLEFVLSQTALAESSSLVDGLVLTGGLDATRDTEFDSALRDQALSGQ